VWTVTSPGGSLTVQSGVYSVQSSPSSDDDVLGGSPLTLTAVDWLQTFMRQDAFASGYATGAELQTIVDIALSEGMDPIGTEETYATLIAALAGNANTDRYSGLTADPSWTPTRVTPFGGDDPLALQGIPFLVTQPGTPATWGDVLDYFWNYEPFRITYGADGGLVLRPGLARRDSGLVISRDAAVGGVLAVPWERLQRAVRDASFTALEYRVIANTPPAEGGSGVGTDVEVGGYAVSQSAVNPHRPGITTTQRITDQTPGASTGAHSDLNAYARHLLAIELGESDQVSWEMDSAFPIAELGDEVRICLADKSIDGWWKIVSVAQPHAEGPSTVTCNWVQDA
jgi:hypothetical protein